MALAVEHATQVLDWQQFVALVKALVPQTRRRLGSLSLLLIAADQLQGGAEREAADALMAVLQQTVREGDVVASHGPRSFALLAADTPQAGAIRLARRVHAAVERRRVSHAHVPATVSIGIATWPESAETARDLLRQAEAALAEAAARGGNRTRLAGWEGPESWLLWELERDRINARRRAARGRLTRAWERGWIRGVRIQPHADACAVCLSVGREMAPPDSLPELPVVGCQTAGGCRCSYASPALEIRPVAPSVDVEDAPALGIPRKLRSAALFGFDPRQRCSPEEVVEYLDHFPMLRFETGLDLPESEVVYLQRAAQQAWEQPGAVGAVLHGPLVPVELPLAPWLKQLGKEPSLPRKALQGTRTGTVYLTNRRILFGDGAAITSLALLQVADVEYLANAVACRAEAWQTRLVFLLDNPLLVSLYLARALRAEVLLC